MAHTRGITAASRRSRRHATSQPAPIDGAWRATNAARDAHDASGITRTVTPSVQAFGAFSSSRARAFWSSPGVSNRRGALALMRGG